MGAACPSPLRAGCRWPCHTAIRLKEAALGTHRPPEREADIAQHSTHMRPMATTHSTTEDTCTIQVGRLSAFAGSACISSASWAPATGEPTTVKAAAAASPAAAASSGWLLLLLLLDGVSAGPLLPSAACCCRSCCSSGCCWAVGGSAAACRRWRRGAAAGSLVPAAGLRRTHGPRSDAAGALQVAIAADSAIGGG